MNTENLSLSISNSIDVNVIRIGLSMVLVIAMILIRTVSRKSLYKLSILYSYEPHRLFLIKKTIAVSYWIVFVVSIIIIWGVNVNNMWIYFGGFLSVISIGLFAVWSILSNIISGIFIFIINPFRIGSKIKLYDPELQATVVNINLMFTELEDDEGIFSVPNNIFFQKTIKVINPKKDIN